MNVTVLMASGDTDQWEGAADTVVADGELHVLGWIEGDEVPGNAKTVELSREIPQDPAPPMEKVDTFLVMAIYAPGMWIKVEFE